MTDAPLTAAAATHDRTDAGGLSFDALAAAMAADGLAHAHARTLWRALHRQCEARLADRADFLPPLRRWVAAEFGENGRFCHHVPEIADETASTDGHTHKLLLRLADGQTVETVIMGYPGRFTACLSTQAGCAMGCVFCATGQMGFVRHLGAAEIVAQVHHAQRHLRARGHAGLRNLVLMGMGEPLHNYDAVMQALEIVTDTRGVNLGPARITISTVGVVPGILRLAAERRPYHLALSLHAASEPERSRIVPASRRWPLPDLMAACRTYAQATNRRLFVEWTLISGRNDSPADAEKVAAVLAGLDAHVNLIPLNPTAGYDGAPADEAAAEAFKSVLRRHGFPCTVRQRRGIDVAAGCGQLKAARRPRPPVTA